MQHTSNSLYFRDDFMGCANISLHEFEENGAEKSQQLFLTGLFVYYVSLFLNST